MTHLAKKASPYRLSDELNRLITQKNRAAQDTNSGSLTKIGGSLAFHCVADLEAREVRETASMATPFRGYVYVAVCMPLLPLCVWKWPWVSAHPSWESLFATCC